MPERKRHPSKDPRRIARDIAENLCLSVLDLAEIECNNGEDGTNAERLNAYWWTEDLINALRGSDTEDKACNLLKKLDAKVPANLRDELHQCVQQFRKDEVPQREAGFLLGLEVGARQSAMILAGKYRRGGRKGGAA